MKLQDYVQNKPVLETEQLILRPLRKEDVADLKEWLGDSSVVHKQDHKVIEDMWVYLIENDRMAKVAFRLSPARQGNGLMTEALARAVIFCFEETELQRLWADVHTQNIASYKTLEKRQGGCVVYYEPQGRHYMAMMDIERVFFCCLYGNTEDEVMIRELRRDMAYEEEMIFLERGFWNNYIQKQVPPLYLEDGDVILASARQYCGKADKDDESVILNGTMPSTLMRYMQLQKQKKWSEKYSVRKPIVGKDNLVHRCTNPEVNRA